MALWTPLTRFDPHACPADALSDLWRFVSRYEALSFDELAATLRDLSDVYVCRDPSGAIGGVVAARITTVGEGPGASLLVWGEWGFLEPAFRGQLVLERAMLRGTLRALLAHPLRRVYFMSEAASWKGYLALARGFDRLWPRPGHPLPPRLNALVESVIARSGDRSYDGPAGVFHRGKPLSAGRSAPSAPRRASRRELYEFYRRANPGQPEGDTLLCVAEVSIGSLLTMPARALAATMLG